jgi:tRNA (mo5U34)-methyltransferase
MIPKCWNEEAISHAKEIREIYRKNPSVGAPLIRTALASYAFYHNIEVAPGIKTAGMAWTDEFVRTSCGLAAGINFEGKRVLDIGCRDGAMSLYAESRGAAEVYAADNDASPGLTNFIVPFKNSIIKPIEININDLDKANLGRFDVIFCCGLVYHLQAPFWGLRQVRDALKPGGILVLETAVLDAFEDFPFVAYLPDRTSPYEPTSPTFFNRAGLRNALSVLGFGGAEASAEFGAMEYNAGLHFPRFADAFPDQRRMRCARFASVNRLDANFSHAASKHSYFDGVHRMHSEGRDRYKTQDISQFDHEHI